MRTFVLFAHGSHTENSGTFNVPANCAVSFFNTHGQVLGFDSAEKCLYSLLKSNGLLTKEVPMSLYLPGDEIINYELSSGAKPNWMDSHELGLYEITSVNGKKQLTAVLTNNDFKHNLDYIIEQINIRTNNENYIIVVVTCRA